MVTGMRRAELLSLRWSDIDLKARTIAIRPSSYTYYPYRIRPELAVDRAELCRSRRNFGLMQLRSIRGKTTGLAPISPNSNTNPRSAAVGLHVPGVLLALRISRLWVSAGSRCGVRDASETTDERVAGVGRCSSVRRVLGGFASAIRAGTSLTRAKAS
jgi:integrase